MDMTLILKWVMSVGLVLSVVPVAAMEVLAALKTERDHVNQLSHRRQKEVR